MIIPPMSVPPNTQHLLLDTNVPAVDFLAPDAIHHSAPQHRILITTDSNNAKRKIPAPTVIKLESSDCSNAVVGGFSDFAKFELVLLLTFKKKERVLEALMFFRREVPNVKKNFKLPVEKRVRFSFSRIFEFILM